MATAVLGRKPRGYCAQQGSSSSHESQNNRTPTRTREVTAGIDDRSIDATLGLGSCDARSGRN
jgi:hypothetical protein